MRVLLKLQLSLILFWIMCFSLVFFDVSDLLDEFARSNCVEVAEVPEADGTLIEGIRVEASIFVG